MSIVIPLKTVSAVRLLTAAMMLSDSKHPATSDLAKLAVHDHTLKQETGVGTVVATAMQQH